MGLFDYRCMISGLSLSSSRTSLILLEKLGENYVPIAFPVYGQYNRLGSIDMILKDENANRILNFFQTKISSREVKVDWEEVYWEGAFLNKIETIEQLMASAERSVTMEYDCITFNGRRIVYALVDYSIWNELTYFDYKNRESVLIQCDTWKEIYKEPISYHGNFVFEFKNIQDFLTTHDIKWTPPNNPGQHSNEEVNIFLNEAKLKFNNEPLIMSGIGAYEKALES